MKKIIIIFCTFLVAGALFQYQRVARKLYLKNETMLRFLKNEPFAKKLHSSPPKWMQEQIEEDFEDFAEKGISKEAIEATYAQIWKLAPMMVRYRIIDNELYRYFSDHEVISFEDNSTEKAIKTLEQRTRFPDMDFILCYYDGVSPEQNYFHASSRDLQAPVLFSAKVKGTRYTPLIPDWRSIGIWWVSDIKHVKVNNTDWDKKKDFAIWRGSLTKPIRRKLCEISLQHPEWLDARLNDLNLIGRIDAALMGDRVSWKELLACKYQPYADGSVCAAPAMQWRLLSNSVVFKPDSDEIQWFYRALKPYVHYVPVKKDLEDLIEKFEWANLHDFLCKEIANNAAQFAQNNLLYSDVLLYFSLVLKKYASLQKFKGSLLKQEVRNDPHWVKIQYRDDVRKRAAEDSKHRYQ